MLRRSWLRPKLQKRMKRGDLRSKELCEVQRGISFGEFVVFFGTLWSSKNNTRHDDDDGDGDGDGGDDDDDDVGGGGKFKMSWYGIFGRLWNVVCACVFERQFRVHPQRSPAKRTCLRSGVHNATSVKLLCQRFPDDVAMDAGRCGSWEIQILWWLGPEYVEAEGFSRRGVQELGQQNAKDIFILCIYIIL